MEHEGCTAAAGREPYDYRRYDQVWQRVAPSLSPYPGGDGMTMGCGMPDMSPLTDAAPITPLGPITPQGPIIPRQEIPPAEAETVCCMGGAAAALLGTLEQFLEEALADQRYYLAFSRQAPAAARQTMRELAAEKGSVVRRLLAVHYLITGRCYCPAVSRDRVYIGNYCPALRERYHVEACVGKNYLLAAEGTEDICLKKILKELSKSAYEAGETLAALLETAVAGACGLRRMGV